MLEEGFYDPSKPLTIRWGDLPHWRQDGALYFITFRLSDSLPEALLARWRADQTCWREQHRLHLNEAQLLRQSLERRRRIERWLDRGHGSCVLRNPTASRIVRRAIEHFDGSRYELGPVAVAPNHVHALVRTAIATDLSEVLYSWKRFAAGELLKIPYIRRAFQGCRHLWQVESFDHIVRNGRSLEKITAYIAAHR